MRSGQPRILLFILLAVIFVIAVLSLIFVRSPVIHAVDPERSGAGDVVTLTGKHFGSETGRVVIGGRAVPRANYREWSDVRVRFVVPGKNYAGLLHLEVKGKPSNQMLFVNTDSAPVPVGGSSQLQISPYVYSVSPNVVPPGRKVVVSGRNFGVSHAVGRIVLEPDPARGEELLGFPQEYVLPEALITLWSTDTIEFYAPAGIISDRIRVYTAQGSSEDRTFEIQDQVGTYQYRDPREISFSLAVNAQRSKDDQTSELAEENESGGIDDQLVIWMPGIPDSSSQRNTDFSRIFPQPQFRNDTMIKFVFSHADIYRLLRLGFSVELLGVNAVVKRYAIETTLLPSRVSAQYDQSHPVYRRHMGDGGGIIIDDELRRRAATLGGRSSNPLLISQALFAAVRSRFNTDEEGADSRSYALELAGLLRARGIPARVITGILMPPGEGARYHHWVEWYAVDFGWVPADVYLADAIDEEQVWAMGFEQEPQYYDGNLDSLRVEIHQG
ncbi:MAG: hypothetical protein D6B26_04070, partial [Spirochaetaceae bacterium]